MFSKWTRKFQSKFWEIEEVPSGLKKEPEDLECEKIFAKTVSRDVTSGRFTLALPFKYSPENLGNSKTNAMRRLLALEKKLGRSEQLRLDYNTAILDFIQRGHMKKLENDDDLGYYTPHKGNQAREN